LNGLSDVFMFTADRYITSYRVEEKREISSPNKMTIYFYKMAVVVRNNKYYYFGLL